MYTPFLVAHSWQKLQNSEKVFDIRLNSDTGGAYVYIHISIRRHTCAYQPTTKTKSTAGRFLKLEIVSKIGLK